MSSAAELVIGDEDARLAGLDVAFRAHYGWLVRRLTFLVGNQDEAEDLAQQVFVKAAENWPIRTGAPVAPWLAVVGTHLAISERRRRFRWARLQISDPDRSWAIEVDPDLWHALGQLDRKTRTALLLTVLDGYTQGEVADAFGVSRSTVASWLSRGRDQLRPLLQENRR